MEEWKNQGYVTLIVDVQKVITDEASVQWRVEREDRKAAGAGN
jgi:hypothetical protein